MYNIFTSNLGQGAATPQVSYPGYLLKVSSYCLAVAEIILSYDF